MYVKDVSPLAMSAECTHFRHLPLSTLRCRWYHLMRWVGLQSRCMHCGLPCSSPLHLLPLWSPPECQIPALPCWCNAARVQVYEW